MEDDLFNIGNIIGQTDNYSIFPVKVWLIFGLSFFGKIALLKTKNFGHFYFGHFNFGQNLSAISPKSLVLS